MWGQAQRRVSPAREREPGTEARMPGGARPPGHRAARARWEDRPAHRPPDKLTGPCTPQGGVLTASTSSGSGLCLSGFPEREAGLRAHGWPPWLDPETLVQRWQLTPGLSRGAHPLREPCPAPPHGRGAGDPGQTHQKAALARAAHAPRCAWDTTLGPASGTFFGTCPSRGRGLSGQHRGGHGALARWPRRDGRVATGARERW